MSKDSKRSLEGELEEQLADVIVSGRIDIKTKSGTKKEDE